MMPSLEFVRLQVVEIVFLFVLAFLPYFVALREVGLTLLFVGLTVGGYRLLKKRLSKRIQPEGQSVFITGCDTGIGHSLARRLASLGFRVFAGCYQTDSEGARALKMYCGPCVHIVPLDITSDNSVEEALQYVTENLDDKGLWAVVNNAGADSFGDVELTTMKTYSRSLEVNLLGAVRITKAFLPLIRRSKGRVMNVSSVKGLAALHKTASYTMAKYALEAFSDCLRIEMRKWGVKVVLIEPGNFGSTTAINKNENWERLSSEVDSMWEEARPSVKEDYGKPYVYEILSALKASAKTGAPSLGPVIDAMEDGLVNTDPKARYIISGSNQLVDLYNIHVFLHFYLPEFVTDFLKERTMWVNYPLPAGVQS